MSADRVTEEAFAAGAAIPLVSVLMTAFNREKYIRSAMDSVLASTFTDFELIVVDDGSTDNTVSIAKEFAAKDNRVRVHVNEKNLGDYPNRNRAASLARGKYLKYVDSDDYIYPWGLGLLVTMMESNPEAGWGLCSLPQNQAGPFPFVLSPAEAYRYAYLGPGLFHKAPLSAIIQKKVFDAAGGFAPGRMVGDFELWHKLSMKFPVLLMPEGIVWSREHAGQEVSSYARYLPDYEAIAISYLNSPDCPLPGDLASGVLRDIKRRSGRNLLRAVIQGNRDLGSYWKTWRTHSRFKSVSKNRQ